MNVIMEGLSHKLQDRYDNGIEASAGLVTAFDCCTNGNAALDFSAEWYRRSGGLTLRSAAALSSFLYQPSHASTSHISMHLENSNLPDGPIANSRQYWSLERSTRNSVKAFPLPRSVLDMYIHIYDLSWSSSICSY